MTFLTLAIVDNITGQLIVDDETALGKAAQASLSAVLAAPDAIGCARPRIAPAVPHTAPIGPTARICAIWHDSFIEGPGRRSVVQFQGCPIRCAGCWVPETWDASTGAEVGIEAIVDALLSPFYSRDGVTIIGGEPFAQPVALAQLVDALTSRQPNIHITVYTGYTFEALRQRVASDPQNSGALYDVLNRIDILIDGRYQLEMSGTAGPWTGSGNQRVIDLAASRRSGKVILFDDESLGTP